MLVYYLLYTSDARKLKYKNRYCYSNLYILVLNITTDTLTTTVIGLNVHNILFTAVIILQSAVL